MYGHILALGLAVLGVDAGWKPDPDGGYQYLVQIKPSALKSYEQGGTVAESEVPSGLRGEVRSFRITVGTEVLPQNPPLSVLRDKPAPTPPPIAPPPSGPTPPIAPPTGTSPMSSTPTSPFDIPPATLPNTKPERPASYFEPTTAKKPVEEPKPAAPAPSTASTSSSGGSLWIWFIGVSVALCGSLSWNVYLLYLLKEARRRYRNLLQRAGLAANESEEEESEDEEEEE